jgi:flagellar biosynthesis/type III secretory pathway protein FliH
MNSHNWVDDVSGPSIRVKRLEADVRQILRKTDQVKLERKYREALADLKQNLVDIRIYVNAYEFSEMRPEQQENAKTAKKWLKQAGQNILKASEANVFSPIDVAHLSAQLEQVKAELK